MAGGLAGIGDVIRFDARGAGHMLIREQRERILEGIAKFIKEEGL